MMTEATPTSSTPPAATSAPSPPGSPPGPRSGRERIAAFTVRVTSLWVLTGALFKLFLGSPNDLPPSVQAFLGGMVTTFRVAIAVELCVVILALLRPRLGWLPLVGLFLFFDAVLVPLATAGEASCGCFGSTVTISPAVMLAIDTVLLAAVLATRPWSTFAKRPLKPLLLAPLFALAILAPLMKFQPVVLDDGAGEDGSAGPTEGEFYEFRTDEWEGQMLHDTDLASFVDADVFPIPCHVVLYRQTCEHCKAHFDKMYENPITDRAVVLIRVPDPEDTPENEVTTNKPADAFLVELPPLKRGYGGVTTPMSFEVDDLFTVGDVKHLRDEE